MTRYVFPLGLGAIMTLAACATTSEAPEVYIPPPVVQTCTPTNQLTRVVIPEETKTFTAITEIENPPYAPIERKETITRVVKEAEIIFVNEAGVQVTDICEEETMTAPEPTG